MNGKAVVFILLTNNFSSATQKVYDYLYTEIISNRLKPGSALSEQEIATILKSSRSPVREALMVLENEGLIWRYPGRGCFVREITMRDVAEIFELRILLEIAAFRRAFQYIDLRALEQVEETLRQLSTDTPAEDYFEADRRLHDLISDSCGNKRLVSFLRTLGGQIEWVRRLASAQPERLAQSKLEHLEIISALKSNDVEMACRLLTLHIKNVQTNTEMTCMRLAISGKPPTF